jgi:hypothetical protein
MVLRLILSVFVVSLTFWTIAFINYDFDDSIESFTNIIYGYVSLFSAPITAASFLEKPWSMVTSFFVYKSFIQLIFDSILIIATSSIFLRFFSSRYLWECIIASHIVGFFFNFLPVLLLPKLDVSMVEAIDLGVIAAAYGLFFTVATAKSNFILPIFKYQVSLKTVALIFLGFNLLMMNKMNFLSISSHFGGAFAGFCFGYAILKKWFPLINKQKMSFGYGTAPKRPVSDEAFNTKRVEDENKINDILEKISKSGYDYLSDEEKEFLFKFKRK